MSSRLLAVVASLAVAFASPDWLFVREPKFLFTFGDSYTSENWDYSHAPASSPLDDHHIATWCNGPVWARQFASAQPATTLVNFAVPGSTIDNAIVRNDWGYGVLDMVGQLATFFEHEHQLGWHGNNSLFAFQFGTNDIWFSLNGTDARLQTYSVLTERMVAAFDQLYVAGARAFALTTAAPFDRARIAVDQGPAVQSRLAERIPTFNAHMKRAVDAWCVAHEDVFCVTVDTYTLVQRIITNPAAYGFKEALDYCPPYTARYSGLESDTYADPSCVGPVSDYLWRDQVHPSYAFHTLWAQLFRDTIDQELARRSGSSLRFQPARIRLRE